MKYPLFSEKLYRDFRTKVQMFVQKHIAPHSSSWESTEYFPTKLLKQCANYGFLGLSIQKSKGGLGKSFWHEVIMAEELARSGTLGWPLSYMVHTQVVLPILADIGSDFIVESIVKPGLAGEFYSALAVTEKISGSDINSIQTSATRNARNIKIHGAKTYISNGSIAQYILTLVKLQDKLQLVLIPAKQINVIQKKMQTNGLKTGDLGEIIFNNTIIPQDYLIGDSEYALFHVFKAIQRERLIGAVALNSLSEHILEKTTAFLKERQRFGRSLSSNQAIQFQFIDLYSHTEAIKHFTYRVCEEYVNNRPVDHEIMMLKILAFEHCQKLIQQCGHLHGAEFFTKNHWLWHLYEDSQAFTLAGGTTEIMKHMLAHLKKLS